MDREASKENRLQAGYALTVYLFMEENSTLFREPRVAAPPREEEEVTPTNLNTEVGAEYKPSERAALNQLPLIVPLLEMGEAYGTFDTAEQVEAIDSFILSEMDRLGMEDTEESYKEILDSYLSKGRFKDGTDLYTKLEVVRKHIDVDKKILQIIKEKEELRNSDPLTLSSEKLRKYMKDMEEDGS